MQTKWLLSSFIFILAIAGISLEQIAVPNQEIVVQFTHEDVTLSETQDAIAVVKEQLKAIGVHNIQVQESVNGRLKITYHSDVDVLSIKRILSQENTFDLGYASFKAPNEPTEFPSEKNTKNYELNVYEIQNGTDFETDFNGYVLEIETKTNRFFVPDYYAASNVLSVSEKNKTDKLAYAIHKNVALAIDNTSYVIPEVRAGPIV